MRKSPGNRSKLFRLGLAGATLLAGAAPAVAGDFSFTPLLTLSEEYNDNVFEAAHDKKSDFITRVQPGAALRYGSRFLTGDASYNFDYHYYARGTRGEEKNHYATLHGSAEILENFLFLDVSDTLSRVSLDVTRDVTGESLFANQSDQNTAVVSPYLLWRLGEKGTLKTGYRFRDTSYWGSTAISKRENQGFADLSVEASPKLTLSAGYRFATVATDIVDYDQHDLNGGFRYEYAEKSFLFGGIGNSWQNFSDSRDVSNLFWNAGISKDFGQLTATVQTRVVFTEDPLAISTKEKNYEASLEKTLENGAWGGAVGYSKFTDTGTRAPDRKKAYVSGFLRQELAPRLSSSLVLLLDKVSRRDAADYAYHLSGTAGLNYAFNDDFSASLSYSYIDYRRDWESSADAKATNRLILALKKLF
jgi:hypothetical protein